MDLRCPRGNKPAKKEEKDSSGKNKSIDSPSTDISIGKQFFSIQQTSSANPKKDQNHQRSPRSRGERGRQGRNTNFLATDINIVPKKEEKDKDMSQVECYNCHREWYYSFKCPQNPKEESKT